VVDSLDVSSVGTDRRQQVKKFSGYQVHFAEAVKNAITNSLTVSSIGWLRNDKIVEKVSYVHLEFWG